MSDMIETFRDIRDMRQLLRKRYGIACPVCREKRPRASATILLPQQRCRIDGHVDLRPELTQKDYDDLSATD